MSALIVIASVLLVLVLMIIARLCAVTRRRRRGPRTVADLVRLRAGEAVTPALPAEGATAADGAGDEPVGGGVHAGPDADSGAGSDHPDGGIAAGDDAGVEVAAGSDTPWGRAARMQESGSGWFTPPRAARAITPVNGAGPSRVASIVRGSAVDTADARSAPVRPVDAVADPAPWARANADRAAEPVGDAGPVLAHVLEPAAAADVAPSGAAGPVDVAPDPGPTGWTDPVGWAGEEPSPGAPPAAGPDPAADATPIAPVEPVPAPDIDQEPSGPASPVDATSAGVPAPRAAVVDTTLEADRRNGATPSPRAVMVDTALPGPAADRRNGATPAPRSAVVDTALPGPAPDRRNGATPVPAPAGRPRRSPGETAAEQAAADLALLRTFGVAGPGHRCERDDTGPELAVRGARRADSIEGAAQPVAFRVVGRTGAGIGGAVATLHDDRGRETASVPADPDGRGTLTAPHPGGYVLVTAAEGHQPGAAALTVVDRPVELEVLLTRAASISGTVAGEDGPQVGAHVVLVQNGETVDTAETDADGRYRFPDLTAGEYGLAVTAPDREPAHAVVRLADEQDALRDVDLAPAGLPA